MDCDPEAGYPSWGEEDVPALFKPLLIPPQVTVNSEVDRLDINYQDLDSDTVRVIQERVKAKIDKNKEHAHRALYIYQGLFIKMFSSLLAPTNVTSDSVRVYLKLFSVKDTNQQRLVRSQMSSIFKHSVRWP